MQAFFKPSNRQNVSDHRNIKGKEQLKLGKGRNGQGKTKGEDREGKAKGKGTGKEKKGKKRQAKVIVTSATVLPRNKRVIYGD